MTVSAVDKTLFDGIRTKCHNVDGVIINKDTAKVLEGCNKSVRRM